MNFYYASKEYCNYLNMYENKIAKIDGIKEGRPFLGVVICVNGKNYFAPMTSPKRKHRTMKDSLDFIRIDKGKFGAINLNNMMPIPKRCLNRIRIEKIEDERYAKLLQIQSIWCKYNKEKIAKHAIELYFKLKYKQVSKELMQRCCKFDLLEKQSSIYLKNNMLSENEIMYTYSVCTK